MKPQRDLMHPATRIARAMERIYRYRMTTTSGGNLSIRDTNGDIWITPARIDKGALRREDIVCVKADGTIEGRHQPSSEYPFHKNIYATRPDVKAVIHAHPVALVAFSISGKIPNTALFAKARQICGKVGFAPYALPGSEKLGEIIAGVFAKGNQCVMLENHGVVVAGGDFEQAFHRFETLEFTAKTILKASTLGEVQYLSESQLLMASQRQPHLGVFAPEPAESKEQALRQELCDFVRRGYHQRLLISSEGSFSARLGPDEFIITGHSVDRAELTPDQLVLVRKGAVEKGKKPSHAIELHRAIYQEHPKMNAIINATPVNATAFAVSDSALDTRTIPESYIFLRDVGKLPYREVFSAPETVAKRLRDAFPVTLIENDGALVIGRSILDAFDRLEVLESTAEAVINARVLGPVKSMKAEVIDELVDAFLK